MVGRLFLGWLPGRCFSVSFREVFGYRLRIGNYDYGRLFHDSGYGDVSTCLSPKKSMAGNLPHLTYGSMDWISADVKNSHPFFFAKTGYQRLIAMEILDAPSNFHIKSQDLPQTTINSFEDLFFKIWFDLNMALPALIGPIIIFVVSNIQPQPTSPNPNTASWSPILWTFFFDHHL